MEHHAGFAHRQSVHVWCLYYVRVVPVHPSMVAYIVITIIVRLCMPRHKGKRREREPGAEVSLATTNWFNAKTCRCSAPALFIDVYPLITPPPSTTAEIQLVKKRARCVSRPPPCSVPRWHRHASHFTPKQTPPQNVQCTRQCCRVDSPGQTRCAAVWPCARATGFE